MNNRQVQMQELYCHLCGENYRAEFIDYVMVYLASKHTQAWPSIRPGKQVQPK